MSKRFCDMCPGTKAHNLSCPRAEYGQVVAPVDVVDASAGAPLRAGADVADDEVGNGEGSEWEVCYGRLVVDATSRECVGKAMRCGNEAETEANARLMAAAPAMLRALRAALDDHAEGETILTPVVRQRIARAVADATGGEG